MFSRRVIFVDIDAVRINGVCWWFQSGRLVVRLVAGWQRIRYRIIAARVAISGGRCVILTWRKRRKHQLPNFLNKREGLWLVFLLLSTSLLVTVRPRAPDRRVIAWHVFVPVEHCQIATHLIRLVTIVDSLELTLKLIVNDEEEETVTEMLNHYACLYSENVVSCKFYAVANHEIVLKL